MIESSIDATPPEHSSYQTHIRARNLRPLDTVTHSAKSIRNQQHRRGQQNIAAYMQPIPATSTEDSMQYDYIDDIDNDVPPLMMMSMMMTMMWISMTMIYSFACSVCLAALLELCWGLCLFLLPLSLEVISARMQ